MASWKLSKNDINVLEKIWDPEADPTSLIQPDPSLPADPHITDATLYKVITSRELDIIRGLQHLELEISNTQVARLTMDPAAVCLEHLEKFDELIQEYPHYASARNNRVQTLRRLYGDGMLVEGYKDPQALWQHPRTQQRHQTTSTVLEDLEAAVRLLSPSQGCCSISPKAAKTLANAFTQRGAIYHSTAKLMRSHTLSVPEDRPESGWTSLDFEEAASRDFAKGAKYGNEIAKGLAVSVNPTAKLCGEMVREAMRKEYGSDFAS